mgnify:CR=1 FL=1
MSHRIVPAEPSHVRTLALNLRAGDAAEIEAAGMTAREALWRSYRTATRARTAFVGDEIAAMWGIAGCPLGRIGKPWLLTAPPIEHAKLAILREGRYEVLEMLSIFSELRGYVDGRYHRALRLLDALGFSLSAEFPFGPFGVGFRIYSMRRMP